MIGMKDGLKPAVPAKGFCKCLKQKKKMENPVFRLSLGPLLFCVR